MGFIVMDELYGISAILLSSHPHIHPSRIHPSHIHPSHIHPLHIHTLPLTQTQIPSKQNSDPQLPSRSSLLCDSPVLCCHSNMVGRGTSLCLRMGDSGHPWVCVHRDVVPAPQLREALGRSSIDDHPLLLRYLHGVYHTFLYFSKLIDRQTFCHGLVINVRLLPPHQRVFEFSLPHQRVY